MRSKQPVKLLTKQLNELLFRFNKFYCFFFQNLIHQKQFSLKMIQISSIISGHIGINTVLVILLIKMKAKK